MKKGICILLGTSLLAIIGIFGCFVGLVAINKQQKSEAKIRHIEWVKSRDNSIIEVKIVALDVGFGWDYTYCKISEGKIKALHGVLGEVGDKIKLPAWKLK